MVLFVVLFVRFVRLTVSHVVTCARRSLRLRWRYLCFDQSNSHNFLIKVIQSFVRNTFSALRK